MLLLDVSSSYNRLSLAPCSTVLERERLHTFSSTLERPLFGDFYLNEKGKERKIFKKERRASRQSLQKTSPPPSHEHARRTTTHLAKSIAV